MFNPVTPSANASPPHEPNESSELLVTQLLNQKNIDSWVARTGQPYVTLSWAQSLDGSLALKQGKSSPISCPSSMRMTHRLRSQHDAILVGIGTVMADDPSLTARIDSDGICKQPRPIVLDSRLRIPADSRLLSHPLRPIIATTISPNQKQQKQLNADILYLTAAANGKIPLATLLKQLGKIGVKSIMVEGGGRIITSFLNAQVVNQAIITIAPVFAGGYDAVQALSHSGWQQLPRLIDMQARLCGSDLIVSGSFKEIAI